jgi:cell division protein FtsZ
MADDVLHSGVRGVTDLIVMPGLINLDFADIKTVMSEMGKAMMGTGEAEGEERAMKAAEAAISNPLLDDVSMKGARGVLINITGGPDLTLLEVDQAANRIRAEVDPDANIIFGGTILENMEGRLRVSVVATGIEADEARMPTNVEQFRPRQKAPPLPPRPGSHPVHSQVEAIAQELNATLAKATAASALASAPELAVAMEEAPAALSDEPTIPAAAATEPLHGHALPALPMRPTPEPQRRRSRWALFGGRREARAEVERAEPLMSAPQSAEARATVQVMSRSQPPQQRATAAPQANADDLFPDLKKEDQFEIPAFLRRQTN